jgi:glycosyltransferase involved in cell wall biosynthesis
VRVLVVTHYFPPEIGAPQARLSDLARHWAASGDDVTVLTGMPNHPTGVVPPAYRRRLRMTERVDDYRVERVWLYATPNEGFLKKTLGHVSFMLTGPILAARRVGRADVVVVSSPTFFSIVSAWFLARLKRAAFVVEVRDLWPAIFVELGVLTNRWLIRLLERFELRVYRAADAVVVVSEGFRRDLITRGVPTAKVHTIRNGVDLDRFGPTASDADSTRSLLGAGDRETLVLYLGAHGISHGLDAVIDAAALLRDRPIHFALVGEGAEKRRLEQRATELGLDNLAFHPGVRSEEVPAIVAAADICLVPLRDVPLFATFIPSKMFELLAAGKPVIGSVRGEAAQLLNEAGAMVVEPDNPVALAAAICTLANDRARRNRMGVEARTAAERWHDRSEQAARYRSLLEDVARTGRPRVSR